MKNNGKGEEKVVRRANVLDFLILLVLLVAVVAIGYRYYSKGKPSRSDVMTTTEVSFEIQNAVFTLPSYVKAGDILYLDDGTVFGTVVDNSSGDDNSALYVMPATVITTDENGNPVRTTYPDSSRVDAQGKLHCVGVMEEDGTFLLDGVRYITPGSAILVYTETASFYLIVTGLSSSPSN